MVVARIASANLNYVAKKFNRVVHFPNSFGSLRAALSLELIVAFVNLFYNILRFRCYPLDVTVLEVLLRPFKVLQDIVVVLGASDKLILQFWFVGILIKLSVKLILNVLSRGVCQVNRDLSEAAIVGIGCPRILLHELHAPIAVESFGAYFLELGVLLGYGGRNEESCDQQVCKRN